MDLSKVTKPMSYLKSHTAEIFKNPENNRQPLIITQNGEAIQASMALLKILAQSTSSVKQGKTRPAKKVFSALRKNILQSAE